MSPTERLRLGNLLNQVGKSVHGRPGLDEVLEASRRVLSPVSERLDRDEECPRRRPRGESVTGSVEQDMEPLPGLESGSLPGREAQEPSS